MRGIRRHIDKRCQDKKNDFLIGAGGSCIHIHLQLLTGASGKSGLAARKQKIGREEENRPDIRSFLVVSVGLTDGKTNQNPLIPFVIILVIILACMSRVALSS